jgi:hypothetical protein
MTTNNPLGTSLDGLVWPGDEAVARLLCTDHCQCRGHAWAMRTTIAVTASIPYRGRNSTFRDSMSVPQLVFLPRAQIAGSAAIFSPRWTMKAS